MIRGVKVVNSSRGRLSSQSQISEWMENKPLQMNHCFPKTRRGASLQGNPTDVRVRGGSVSDGSLLGTGVWHSHIAAKQDVKHDLADDFFEPRVQQQDVGAFLPVQFDGACVVDVYAFQSEPIRVVLE